MENKSKKSISIFMIVGGLLVLINYLFKPDTVTDNTNNIIIMVCASVFVILGIISLRNTIKKQRLK
jgi:hypothetical protein